MFKNLFRRRPSPEPVAAPQPAPPPPQNPFLTVEMDLATGNINGFAFFPRPVSEEAAQAMAANFGAMTFLLNDGSLLPVLQQAIVMGGAASGLDGVAQMTLSSLTTLLQSKTQRQASSSQPVVRPTTVFQRPGSVE